MLSSINLDNDLMGTYMPRIKKLVFVLFLCITTPAIAQWQTPVNTVPIGRGPGVQGFNSMGGASCVFQTNGSSVPSCAGSLPFFNPLVIGSTPITGGNAGGVLYKNSGVLGSATTINNGIVRTDGSGNPVASVIMPSFAMPGNIQFQDGTTSGFIGTTTSFLTDSTVFGTLNATPVGFLYNNGLAGSIGSSGWTFNLPVNIVSTTGTLNQGINITQTPTSALSCAAPGAGPPTAPIFFGCAYNSIFINPNNTNGNGGVVHGLSVQMFNSGANVNQSSTAFFANYTSGVAATTATDRVAISGLAQIDSNQGGTGTGAGTAKGSVVTTNYYAIAGNNATNLFGINGMEMNVTARVGSSLYAKNGMSVVLQSDDAVQASGAYSVGYSLASQAGSVNWKCGFCANDLNGQNPITATGTIFGTIGAGNVGSLIDVSSYTPASWIFKATNFTVDNNGTANPAGGIVGVTTNSNAAAGIVGEYPTIGSCNGSAITTNTDTNCGSIALTAGDWDLSATWVIAPAATTTVGFYSAGINTVTATVPSGIGTYCRKFISTGATGSIAPVQALTCEIPPMRVSLAAPATYYLNGNVTYGTSTLTQFGTLHARRPR